jgi:predicted nucleotidyltransferase
MSATILLPSPKRLAAFCREHGIRSLRLFGSANREDFDPARSDVDLLVEYQPGRHPGLGHFTVAEELSEIFGRKVDLNTPAMLGRFLAQAQADATTLYEQA